LARFPNTLEGLRADHRRSAARLEELTGDLLPKLIEQAELRVAVELHEKYGEIIDEIQGEKRNDDLRLGVLADVREAGTTGAALKDIRRRHGRSVDALMPKLVKAGLVQEVGTRIFSITPDGEAQVENAQNGRRR
jgi:hypothetical protein